MNGFIDYLDARKVAEAVYGDVIGRIIPDGFVLDNSFNFDGTPGYLDTASGLYVYALVSTTDPNVRVLAYRGTEPTNAMTFIQDLIGNVQDIGKGQFDSDTDGAINQWLAANLSAGNNVEIVGHSLGGALAQWTINDTNLNTLASLTGLSTIELADSLHFTTFLTWNGTNGTLLYGTAGFASHFPVVKDAPETQAGDDVLEGVVAPDFLRLVGPSAATYRWAA